MRVTDLEEFAERDIWSPYWPMHPDAAWDGGPERYRDGLRRMGRRRHTLTETLTHLHTHQEWAEHVTRRLAAIGTTFPAYITHPLVDWLRPRVTPHSQQGAP